MSYTVVFKFPGTGYTSHMYTSNHPADAILAAAKQVWESVPKAYFPFQGGDILEKPVTPEHVRIIKALFAYRADWVKQHHTPEEFEKMMSNDQVALELMEFNKRWYTESIIDVILELAARKLPDLNCQKVDNVSSIDIW